MGRKKLPGLKAGLAFCTLMISAMTNIVVVPSCTCSLYQHYLNEARQEAYFPNYRSPEHKAQIKATEIMGIPATASLLGSVGSFYYFMRIFERRKGENEK